MKSVAETAALIGDPGRASILTALMGGVAMPAGQLAMIANVAPQTASSHLAKLVEGRLLKVESQGRHRYYRLADAEVAHAVEALMAIAPAAPIAKNSTCPESLQPARTCYSHLAGVAAVQICDGLRERGLIELRKAGHFTVSSQGQASFQKFGLEVSDAEMTQPGFARPCLDWSERRHHISGQLGIRLLARLQDLKWVARVRDSRAVRITLNGETELRRRWGVRLPRR
jgi:DNA-binding transcriptional ArsR family regulator